MTFWSILPVTGRPLLRGHTGGLPPPCTQQIGKKLFFQCSPLYSLSFPSHLLYILSRRQTASQYLHHKLQPYRQHCSLRCEGENRTIYPGSGLGRNGTHIRSSPKKSLTNLCPSSQLLWIGLGVCVQNGLSLKTSLHNT